MRIINHTCPNCGTVIAGNILERHRVIKCPGLGCETIRRFEDLPEDEQEHIEDNLERFRMD